MANVRDIRRRIRSVKNTQQITKAMKMVAAAKLRKAQDRMFAARPYSAKMKEVLNSLASRAEESGHPLLHQREEKRVLAAVVTADRGLCGAFNTNIIRRATEFCKDHPIEGDHELSLAPIGTRGRDFFKRRPYPFLGEWPGIFRNVQYAQAEEIAQHFITEFTEDRVDSIYLIYNEFKSVIQQNIVVERVLPIERLDFDEPSQGHDYIYEPSDREIFESLLPKHLAFQIYHALLESQAAEHGARMSAMENATKNAKEMIDSLTLLANRIRQAVITKELIEIVSGAEALE